MTTPTDNAGVIALPPALAGGTLVVVLVLNWLQPMPVTSRALSLGVGIAFLALGVGIAIWGRRTLTAAGTNVNPGQPTTTIVTTGPYRFSRNPLYVGLITFYVGATLLFNTWWGFLLLPPLFAVLHSGVVLREERYLEGKFGDAYRHYRAKVRRYL